MGAILNSILYPIMVPRGPIPFRRERSKQVERCRIPQSVRVFYWFSGQDFAYRDLHLLTAYCVLK